MLRRVLPLALVALALAALSGCGVFRRPHRPAWRGQAEAICLAEKRVQPSAFIVPMPSIEGPGICGLDHPFRVIALAGGTVRLNAPATIGCPLTAALDAWLANSIQPSAEARLGTQVVQINTFGAYNCRSIDHRAGARLSEHSFGNAIDIAGFRFADGSAISILNGWNSPDDQVRAFLHEAEAGACEYFTTVLAPGSDSLHHNHFHLDLAMHGNTSHGPRRYCRPIPQPQLLPPPSRLDNLPNPPQIDEELDSQNGASQSAVAMSHLSASIPPVPVDDYTRAQIRRDAGAPLSLSRSRPSSGRQSPATIRPDGVYVPEGSPADWDVTSSIRKR